MVQKTIYITSGTTWPVPDDCPQLLDLVECWGGGQGGETNPAASGRGGAGGTYVAKAGVNLGGVSSVAISIGAAGAANLGNGGDTQFKDASTLVAPGGGSATTAVGGTINAGGAGGASVIGNVGDGGGGAGGPDGAGKAGGNGNLTGSAGGGGGGSDGGTVGGDADAIGTGGVGGNNHAGSGGGTPSGGAGSNGGGGAGGNFGVGAGGNGGGNVDQGGGGGGGRGQGGAGNAGVGGFPGGGGGASTFGNTGAVGAAGQIKITYTPITNPWPPETQGLQRNEGRVDDGWFEELTQLKNWWGDSGDLDVKGWFDPDLITTTVSNKTLPADPGSYALTGTAAGVQVGRKVAVAAGSYALTGTNATLRINRPIVAGAGSYALTGTATGVEHGWKVAAAAGSYALTGTAATLRLNRKLPVAAGSYALTGMDATLRLNRKLPAGVGSYVFSGTDAALTIGGGAIVLAADVGSYLIGGAAVGLLQARRIVAEGGSYVLTGSDVTLTVSGAPTPVLIEPIKAGGHHPKRRKILLPDGRVVQPKSIEDERRIIAKALAKTVPEAVEAVPTEAPKRRKSAKSIGQPPPVSYRLNEETLRTLEEIGRQADVVSVEALVARLYMEQMQRVQAEDEILLQIIGMH